MAKSQRRTFREPGLSWTNLEAG